jgi:hypothetical protein
MPERRRLVNLDLGNGPSCTGRDSSSRYACNGASEEPGFAWAFQWTSLVCGTRSNGRWFQWWVLSYGEYKENVNRARRVGRNP